MVLGKSGIHRLNFTCGLADDLEIADNGILNERTPIESRQVEAFHIGFDALNSRNDVLDIILNAERLFVVHTGLASATTLLRNVADKSSGVFTSTFARVRFSTAAAMAAISKRVMPSAASIKRSRSLASVSSR